MSSATWRDWTCEVRVVVDDGPVDTALPTELADVVTDLMDEVAHAIDRFRADSELSRLNRLAPALMPVSSLASQIIDAALDAAAVTGGLCDPTVGSPAGADWRRVVVDRDLRRIGLPAGTRLTLDAIGKAWTADEAARRLADRTGTSCLVGIGGDLAAAGHSRIWPIIVGERAGGPGQEVALDRGGVATSSTVVRRWDAGPGHHVIDPATSLPSTSQIRTASIWSDSCVTANAWSTAAVVGGASVVSHLPARLVSLDGTVVTTGQWPTTPAAVA